MNVSDGNVSDGIERMRRRNPTKVAIITDDGDSISYGQLDANANRIARFLRERQQVGSGDRVGILAGNSVAFLRAFYGIVRAGAIAVPLNEEWSTAEFDACLSHCQPVVVLVRQGSRLNTRLSLPIVELNDGPSPDSLSPEWGSEPLPDKPWRDQPFYIGYTSGSTGKPKGVLRSHGSWVDSYLAATVEFQCSAEDRVLAPGPLFFSLSLFAVTHALFLGSTACIMSRVDPGRVLEMVAREKVTTICMVPALYEALLHVRKTNRLDLRSVKTLICAGSAWPRANEAKRELLSRFPSAGLYEYYGAAEMSFVSVSYPEEQMARPRSVGRSFLGVSVEIRREDGTMACPGEIGTLYARSPFAFEGYYGDPARTSAVKQDGWMTVGDLAYADEQGYLYIAGRKDNVVITGGVNVNVEEVEAVLGSHPKVRNVAVLGLYDRRRGQVLAALVQRREGADLGTRELRAHCAAHLAPYKVPRRLRIVEAIPTTATGKINRPELIRLFGEPFALEQDQAFEQGQANDRG